MTVSASAPGRCGIIGNPSDIYGGVVVSCSVPLRATCNLTVAPASVPPEDALLWNAVTARWSLPPCRVEWRSDIPRSSGLGGSTALLAATVACALALLRRLPVLPSAAFAELVRDVEANEAKVVCGFQDAYMVVFGGLRRLDFAGKHPIDGGPEGTVTALHAPLPFLVVTTGVERLSGSVHGPMRERWLRGDREVVDAMDRIADLGRAGADVLVRGDWSKLAHLMDENHALIAALGGSGDSVDRLIALCINHGALSAKLAGAGMGGTVIALTENPDDLEARLRAEGYSQFTRPTVEPGCRIENLA